MGASSTIWSGKVRPSGCTAQYATVVMPTPPAAIERWCCTSAWVGAPPGAMPSLVADLTMRLRSFREPSVHGVSALWNSAE